MMDMLVVFGFGGHCWQIFTIFIKRETALLLYGYKLENRRRRTCVHRGGGGARKEGFYYFTCQMIFHIYSELNNYQFREKRIGLGLQYLQYVLLIDSFESIAFSTLGPFVDFSLERASQSRVAIE